MGPGHNRGPSFKGRIMVDLPRGSPRVRSWPRSRGTSLHPKTKNQMEWFRLAQWATKYTDPGLVVSVTKAVKGTPLMPRDILTMIAASRLCSVGLDDGRVMYPRVARGDVSTSLDLITPNPGSILYRGALDWEGLDGGPESYVLTSQGPTEPPVWLPGTPEGVGQWAQIGLWNQAVDGNKATVECDVTGLVELMVIGQEVVSNSSVIRAMQVSVDAGANWFTTSGNYISIGTSGTNTNQAMMQGHINGNAGARNFSFQMVNNLPGLKPLVFAQIAALNWRFEGSALPINRVRIMGSSGGGGAPTGLFTGGKIQFLAR